MSESKPHIGDGWAVEDTPGGWWWHVVQNGHVVLYSTDDKAFADWLAAALNDITELRATRASIKGEAMLASCAAIEAFCQGLETGKPTEAQIEALIDASGNLKRVAEGPRRKPRAELPDLLRGLAADVEAAEKEPDRED